MQGHLDLHSLALIKYQQTSILFLHRPSRNVYRYLNGEKKPEQFAFSHPSILSGQPFDQGFLYLKEQSTLLSEIHTRARSHLKNQFSEEEIANTFIPIFDGLTQFQQKGRVHGSVHPENILILENQIQIRDGNAPTQLTISYYPQQKQQKDDIYALGLCLINCVLLTTQKPEQNQLDTLVEKIFENYSKAFIIIIMIIIRKEENQYKNIVKLFEGDIRKVDSKLNDAYESIRLEKERKKKGLTYQETPGYNHITTIKKIGFHSTLKKAMHFENSENKVGAESKKSIQKLTKALEKCSISHELMNKKMNEEEKKMNQESFKRWNKTPILNLSNFGVENNNKKPKDRMSPLYRPKHFSKKK